MALHTASFLPSADLARLAACASYWRGLLFGDGARWLWRDALQQEVRRARGVFQAKRLGWFCRRRRRRRRTHK